MSRNVLRIGPIIFAGLEVPEKIVIGGSQQLAVHKTLDGNRVIDALGTDEADVRFTGIISGPDAVRRAQLLDAIRRSQAVQILTWNELLYPVLIREFVVEIHGPYWIHYRMRCAIAPWPDPLLPAITAVDQVAADLGAIAEVGAGVSPFSHSATEALTNLMVRPQDTGVHGAATRAVSDVRLAVRNAIQATDQGLVSAGTQPSVAPAWLAGNIQQLEQMTHEMWLLVACESYWGRIAANLTELQS